MRFFVSDVDKTLLRSDLTLSNFTKNVWNSFSKPITIATARSYTGAKKLLKDLHFSKPLILLDGAMIADPDGKIIHLSAIGKELGDEIIKYVEKTYDERPLVVGLEGNKERFLYPKRLNPHQQELLQNYKNDNRVLNIENLQALPQNLKIVYLGSGELLSKIEEDLKSLFPIETKLSKDPYQNCHFLTILHPHGDKAHALKKLEEIEGIEAKEVTVFGDSLNDIGMFEWAGVAVAVKNALPEVKERAHIVLERTNDEDAIAHYLATL